MHHLKLRPSRTIQLQPFWCQASSLDPDSISIIIRMGGAYLNGKRCKDPSQKVGPQDLVELYYRTPIQFQSLDFDPQWIVAKTPDYLIVNKPAGIPTQGRRDADSISLFDALSRWQNQYVGLHHRLDQDTSGLLLFTTNPKVNRHFAQLFQEQKIHKRYLAICQGPWPYPQTSYTLEAAIGPDYGGHAQKQKVSAQGKTAVTHLTLIAALQDRLLVAAEPQTGRTHQIRVHCAHAGIPLVGDHFYGHNGPPPFRLHCFSLAWPKKGPIPAQNFYVLPDWSDIPTEHLQAAR